MNHDFKLLAELAYQSGRYPEALRVQQKQVDQENSRFYIMVSDRYATLAGIELTMRRGAEAGIDPLTALYNIVWYNNRPCIWGDVAKAMIRSHKDFVSMDITGDAETATCIIKRKSPSWLENGQACWVNATTTRTFSWDDAKNAGLDRLEHYQKFPREMLEWRAFFRAARHAFADVLYGLSIAEEQRDVDDDKQQVKAVEAADKPPEPDEFTKEAMDKAAAPAPDYQAAHSIEQTSAETKKEHETFGHSVSDFTGEDADEIQKRAEAAAQEIVLAGRPGRRLAKIEKLLNEPKDEA